MSSELIKLFAPVLIIGIWTLFALRVKSVLTIGAALFFTSVAAFSQNFSFVYREVHQVIQILMIIVFVLHSLHSGKILKINKILFGFLLFIGASLVFVSLDSDAKSQLVNYLVVAAVVNYLFLSLRTSDELGKIFSFIASLSVLLAILGLFEFLIDPAARVEVTFSNPNYYGLFLGVGFCIVFVQWKGWRRSLALALIVTVILMSGSRSAIAFPVLQILWKLYSVGNLRKALPIAIAFVISTTLVLGSGITRYSDTEKTESSDAERIIFALIALRMVEDYPFTGVGWGRFISEFGNYSTSAEQVVTSSGVTDVSQQDRRVTHNDYLRILAELGWIAFISAIILSIYGAVILIINKGFNIDCVFPIWLGLLFFSLGHNNLNGAFFWFFFLLPFFLKNHTRLSNGKFYMPLK